MILETFLNGFAILSTIVATLRAGSRVLYISENGAIGLVDGPRIAPPDISSISSTISENKTESIAEDRTSKNPYNAALYEIAENFKQCVKISSSRTNDQSHHGCENLLRDRLIPDIPPVPRRILDAKAKPSEDDSSSKSFFNGGFRKFQTQIQSLMGAGSQSKKDPFGEKAYTLGYAHYSPRTFQEKKGNNKSLLESPDQTSETEARSKITEAIGSALYDYEGPLDFGRATEADYFYNTVFQSSGQATMRRRVAQLKSYCPETFKDLRSSIFGISEEEYLQSMLGTMVSFQSNSKGAARAGGIFFFTSDGAYMIKTIPNREKKTLLKYLPDYYKHMKRNRSSLLTRFCGMYGIEIEEEDEATAMEPTDAKSPKDILASSSDSEEDSSSSFAPTGKEYTFVVMNAVFPAEASSFVSERFDLKGSTVGREVSLKELESKGRMAVLKDLNLKREVDLVRTKQIQQQEEEERAIINSGRRGLWGRSKQLSSYIRRKKGDPAGFTIGATAKAALLSQLRKDVQFLTHCQVMDYSLLVGVVNTDNVDIGLGEGSSAGALTPDIVGTIQEQKKVLEQLEGSDSSGQHKRRRPKLDSALMHTLTTPVRLMLSPPLYVARKSWNTIQLTLKSIVTAPLPYYGSGRCGVYGGKLSVMHGKRKGDNAVYYLGLIDFLQPWTTRKVMERKLKGLAGYDTNAVSAVTPEEYATRFLEFLDKHIN